MLAPLIPPVLHPPRQQIEAFSQAVKLHRSPHSKSSRPKTCGSPTSRRPTSKTQNTVVPRSTRLPRSFGRIQNGYRATRFSFRTVPALFRFRLAALHTPPFGLDFAFKFRRTVSRPRRYCARRRAPHDDSINILIFEDRFSLHTTPRGVSPA